MRAHPAIRHVVAALVLLGVLASGSSVLAGVERAGQAGAATAGDELMVFSSLRHGNSEIYAVRPDGTGIERLTDHAAADTFPTLSPDGERVAFASTRTGRSDIYVMDVDGSDLRRLTTHSAIDTEPTWSTDGSRIAFTSARTGAGDVYVMSSADGSDLVRVTSHSAADTSPAWSPDGPVIAFSSLRSGLGDVYRVRADGSQLQRLTTSVASDLFPAWSPDGEHIAFASLRTGLGDIYRMQADGSAETRITQGEAVDVEPAWSPDGTRLAISSKAQGTLNIDLRIVDVATGSGAPLAPHPALDASPHWIGSDDPGPDPGGGVLLEGDPSLPASEAVTTLIPREGVPLDEFSLDDSGTEIARTQMEIGLAADATVGQVNALLESVDGRIVSMLDNVSIVLVRIPDPETVAGLEALISEVAESPIVRFAAKAESFLEDQLPANHADLANELKIDHNLAIRLPAAWNAREAIEDTAKPLVVVADSFGGGVPTSDVDAMLQASDFGSGQPTAHGYHVLGIIAADYAGDTNNRGLATGVFPDAIDVRVVDGIVDANTQLTNPIVENAVLSLIATTSGNVVLNTSFGSKCDTVVNVVVNCSEFAARSKAQRWIEKVRGQDLESRFVHATSAGNVRVASDTDARLTSAFAAARLLPLDEIPNLTNTLVVENVRDDALQRCLSVRSKSGGDLAGIGTDVWSLTDAGSTAGDLSGTSMSAPQVAGLAAYVWSLAPQLTVQQVTRILVDTASPGVSDSSDVCSPTTSKPVVDAYEAVLSLDAAALPTVANAPIRGAILDQDDDSRFTLVDVEEFLDHYVDPLTGEPKPTPDVMDYGRYDLNGDGFTGGMTLGDFDLDRVDSMQYGAPLYSDDVEQQIAGETVTFDENAVTDLEVLCYYAYSDLFVPVDSGDLLLLDDLLADFCLPGEAKIAFVSSRDGNSEIYVMNADGSGQTRLTNNPAGDSAPAWSPDGTRIAFQSTRAGGGIGDIYVMNADGTGQTRLTTSSAFPGANSPMWSPDGTKIAYVSYSTGTAEIFVMNADGTNQTNVTNTPTVPEVDPRWSSDGSKLAFRSNGAQFTEIFVMSADGSGRTQLTNSSSQVVAELHDWSPSGSRLLFARLVGSPLRRDLFVINADGSGETNITNTAVSDFNATWSPDGSRIAFMRSGDIGESSSDVYVANADGSAATKLTSLADIGAFPQIPGWSPDGVRIAFTAKVGPTFTEEIFTIGANGSDLSRLTTNTATDNQLVWSP